MHSALLAKSVADPLHMAWRPIDQEYIEAARGFRAPRQIEARRGDDARTFGGGHALRRAAEAAGPAHAHLGEDQSAALLGNQVDLAVPAAPIALDETQSGRSQQVGAEILGSRAFAVHGTLNEPGERAVDRNP